MSVPSATAVGSGAGGVALPSRVRTPAERRRRDPSASAVAARQPHERVRRSPGEEEVPEKNKTGGRRGRVAAAAAAAAADDDVAIHRAAAAVVGTSHGRAGARRWLFPLRSRPSSGAAAGTAWPGDDGTAAGSRRLQICSDRELSGSSGGGGRGDGGAGWWSLADDQSSRWADIVSRAGLPGEGTGARRRRRGRGGLLFCAGVASRGSSGGGSASADGDDGDETATGGSAFDDADTPTSSSPLYDTRRRPLSVARAALAEEEKDKDREDVDVDESTKRGDEKHVKDNAADDGDGDGGGGEGGVEGNKGGWQPAPAGTLPPLLRMSTARAALVVGSPVMAMGLLRSAFNLTDAYWAGKLGAAQLSALCYNAFALWLIHLTCSVMATGVQARVSSHVGAGDDAAVARTVVQGLWGAAAVYACLLAAAPAVPKLYASGLGIEQGTAAYAAGRAHLIALIVGSAGLAAGNVLEAAFRGLGQTRVALYVTACTVGLAAVLDPALMLGFGPVPGMGIVGAAVGYSCAGAVGAALHARALRRVCGVKLEWAKPDAREIARLVRIGAPLASSGVVFTLVYIAIGRIASGLGENYLAAMGLGQKFEAVPFTVCEGFRLACATLVGQWLGAGRPKRARAAAAVSTAMCVAAMLPFAAALFLLGPTLVGMFSSDPAIVTAAGGYLRWNSGVLMFLALEAVTEGAFTGVGNTFPILCIGAACNLGRIPVAHHLATAGGWGVSGVWAAIVASQVAKAVCKSWWFRRRVMTRLEEESSAAARARGEDEDDDDDEEHSAKKGLLGLVW